MEWEVEFLLFQAMRSIETSQALINFSPVWFCRCKKLADYLKVVIALHFLLGVLEFVALDIIRGIFDLLSETFTSTSIFAAEAAPGCLIGYYSIKNPDGINVQAIVCYTVYMMMQFVWAFVSMILFYAKVTKLSASTPQWQYVSHDLQRFEFHGYLIEHLRWCHHCISHHLRMRSLSLH